MEWPFTDPPNTVVFTTRMVLDGGRIRRVYRDWEDGAWQVFSAGAPDLADAKLVCLKSILALEPSLAELADLPPGWRAERGALTSRLKRWKDHPFPVYADDKFYLEDATEYHRFDPAKYPIPSEEVREGIRVGDYAKLSFRFAGEESPRSDNQCERMWVEVCEVDEERMRYRATLANDPELHPEIAFGHPVWFHPIHVFDIQRSSAE